MSLENGSRQGAVGLEAASEATDPQAADDSEVKPYNFSWRTIQEATLRGVFSLEGVRRIADELQAEDSQQDSS
jgi:hypothetical protein